MVSQIESTTLINNAYKYNPRYAATVLHVYRITISAMFISNTFVQFAKYILQ